MFHKCFLKKMNLNNLQTITNIFFTSLTNCLPSVTPLSLDLSVLFVLSCIHYHPQLQLDEPETNNITYR